MEDRARGDSALCRMAPTGHVEAVGADKRSIGGPGKERAQQWKGKPSSANFLGQVLLNL